MTAPVFLNGRFLTQPVTGVQRFAGEITAAIDRLVDKGGWPPTQVLAPRAVDGGTAMPYRHLRVHAVGRSQGHVWEQTALPRAARGGILVSLGNTAPVLAGRRQLVVIHDAGVYDTPDSYSLQFRIWYKAILRGLVSNGARIATVSEFSRRRIVARLGLDPARVTVMSEGADHILRVTGDPDTLERHNLRPRGYALVVGNRVAHKNLAALRDVATALQRRGMSLAVAGASDPAVFAHLPNAPLTERRLGRVSDAELRALYESAACLIFPSRYEGFGLPPVEAMACGCPVLAAAGGAVEEICGDGALYFDVADRHSIARAVERLLDERGLADDMRARGRVRAAAITWEASARTLGATVHAMQ